MSENAILGAELEYFEEKKAELLGESAGRFVLVKEREIHGTFDTKHDAIARAYEKFGNEPFLVKEIVEIESVVTFTRLSVA